MCITFLMAMSARGIRHGMSPTLASTIASVHGRVHAEEILMMMMGYDRSSQHHHADYHQQPCYEFVPFHRMQK
jgi:hypothetical protein